MAIKKRDDMEDAADADKDAANAGKTTAAKDAPTGDKTDAEVKTATGEPKPEGEGEGTGEGTGTDNSPAKPVENVATEGAGEAKDGQQFGSKHSNPTAAPPAKVVQRGKVAKPANVTEGTQSGDVHAELGVEAEEGSEEADKDANPKLEGVDLSKAKMVYDQVSIRDLKDGEYFYAAWACEPGSDNARNAGQIIDELVSGRVIKHGLTPAYWQHHYRSRPPVAQKQGNDFVMLD